MVKQKMVIKLPLGKKTRSKALQTAAGMEGVISVELDGDDRLVLVGDGTDAVKLTILLRKKLGFAEVVSVTSVDEKDEHEDDDEDDDEDDEDSTNSTSPQRDQCYCYPSCWGCPYGSTVPHGYYPYPPWFYR